MVEEVMVIDDKRTLDLRYIWFCGMCVFMMIPHVATLTHVIHSHM